MFTLTLTEVSTRAHTHTHTHTHFRTSARTQLHTLVQHMKLKPVQHIMGIQCRFFQPACSNSCVFFAAESGCHVSQPTATVAQPAQPAQPVASIAQPAAARAQPAAGTPRDARQMATTHTQVTPRLHTPPGVGHQTSQTASDTARDATRVPTPQSTPHNRSTVRLEQISVVPSPPTDVQDTTRNGGRPVLSREAILSRTETQGIPTRRLVPHRDTTWPPCGVITLRHLVASLQTTQHVIQPVTPHVVQEATQHQTSDETQRMTQHVTQRRR